PILLHFDQDVDPARILPFLRVGNGHGKPLVWKTVPLAEARGFWMRNPTLQSDARARGYSEPGAHEVIIAPATAWPPGIDVKVTLSRGAPSAEGTRPTDRESFASFAIAPEFTVKGVSCDGMRRPRLTGAVCPADDGLSVEFSNAIDQRSYRSSKVQIAGEKLDDRPAAGGSVSRVGPARIRRSDEDAIGERLLGD